MPYVFVVHSRLVQTRLPLAKAFLRAILTVNTYPFDWHLRCEYMDIQPSTYPHRHEPLLPRLRPSVHLASSTAPQPSSRRVGRHIASVRASLAKESSFSDVTLFVTRRYLKISSSFPRFVSRFLFEFPDPDLLFLLSFDPMLNLIICSDSAHT